MIGFSNALFMDLVLVRIYLNSNDGKGACAHLNSTGAAVTRLGLRAKNAGAVVTAKVIAQAIEGIKKAIDEAGESCLYNLE
jgi:hypothetical protein